MTAGLGLVLADQWAKRRIAAVETLDAEEAAPGGAFATVGGFRIHYVTAGSPEKPAVVLLHGFGSSLLTWDAILGELADRYYLILPDLPGFGYSQRTTQPVHTMRQRAASVIGLLDHLGVRRAHFVGNSLGGAVALQIAFSQPERVDRLVLVDAVAGYRGMEGKAPWLLGRLLRHTPLGKIVLAATFYNPPFVQRILASAYHDPARLTPERIAEYTAPLRVRGSAATMLAVAATRRDDDLPPGLWAIRVPTLIVWGQQDRWIKPRWAERLHADIPGSRLMYLDDCGHVPHEECPEEFSWLLAGFLASPH
jgi:pimeloyl-ACP methyl ester carboxylesterase